MKMSFLWQMSLVLLFAKKYVNSVASNLHLMDGTRTADIIGDDVFFEIIEPEELEYTYRLKPAKNFGASFTDRHFKLEGAPLLLAQPADACKALFNARDMKGSVALVERGECSFLSKAVNVENAGGLAIIVSDMESLEQDYYIEMIDDNTTRPTQIPAGYLVGKSGRVIRQTLDKLNRDFALINLPVNLTFIPAHKINHPPWLVW